MRSSISEWLVLMVIVLLVAGAVNGLYKADHNHCRQIIQMAQTKTDSLIVISSRRCSFIAQEILDARGKP